MYDISFNVVNPLFSQPAVQAFIAISGPIVLSSTQITSANSFSAPLLVTGTVESTGIGQSSPSAGVENTITVTLQTLGVIMGPHISVGFVLAGITGVSTPVGTVLMNISSPHESAFGLEIVEGFLTLDGQLQFTVQGSKVSGTNNIMIKSLLISFKLTNGLKPQASQVISISSPDIGIPWTILDSDSDSHAPLLIAGFLFANISQSTTSQGTRNDITLMFRVQTDLPLQSTLLISGLVGASSGPVIVISDITLFSASWSAERNDSLVLSILNPIPAIVMKTVIFRIENPLFVQNAPSISIEGTGKIVMGSYPVSNAKGDQAALVTAGFRIKSITQSSVAALSKNLYTVQMSSNTIIAGSNPCTGAQCTTISIFGLSGTTQSSTVSIGNASGIFGGTYASGRLSLKVLQTIKSNTLYIFNFELINPDSGLESPVISIESSGMIIISPVDMTSGPGNLAPCLVAGFVEKNISESSAAQLSSNTISMNVSLNVDVSIGLNWAIYLSNLIDIGLFTFSTSPPGFTFNGGKENQRLQVDDASDSLLFPLTFKNIARNEVLSLSFSVFNPGEYHASPSISIQLVQVLNGIISPISSPVAMQTASYLFAPLFVNGFDVKQIKQSTASASARNNITISLHSYSSFPAGTTIIVSGLTGSNTNSTSNMSLIPLQGSTRAVLSSYGSWNKERGQLLFSLTAETNSLLSFTFTIQNSAQGQRSPQVYIEATYPYISQTEMNSSLGNQAPLLIAGFITKVIGQSNPSCSVNNTLSVTLANFASLGNESAVTITGLTGSATLNNTGLPINSTVFTKAAIWTQGNGMLILRLAGRLDVEVPFVFTFVLVNPSTQQSSPSVSIEVHGIEVSRVTMEKGAGNSAPLLVAGFTQFSLGQSTPSQRANNTLTATLALNVILSPSNDAVITISGLRGSQTNTPTLSISALRSGHASSEFGATAKWNRTSGSLFLVVRYAVLYPEFIYEISFTLKNPDIGQESPPVYISCGFLNLNPIGMIPGPADHAPLLVAGFLLKAIGQNNPSASVLNTLTLTLSVNVPFPKGALLTIAGLSGCKQPSTEYLALHSMNASSPFSDRAAWNRDQGTLIASLGKPLNPHVAYVISFVLLNPAAAQVSPSVSLLFEAAGVIAGWETANEAADASSPLVISGFVQSSLFMWQSSAEPSQVNTLTVTLSTLVPLLPGTAISLTGLSGASPVTGRAVPPVTIPVLGNFSEFIGGSAQLLCHSATLVLSITTITEERKCYSFSFNVSNPVHGQLSPSISIETSGTVLISRMAMVKATGKASPLVIAGFISKSIGQTDPSASANNTISLTLAFFVGISNGTLIIISGLTGSSTADSTSLAVTANTSLLSTAGLWTQSNGSMIIRTIGQLLADTEYVISFVLTNPSVMQSAPPISLEVLPGPNLRYPTIPREAAIAESGNAAPLLIAGFIQLAIRQSTPSAGATANIITANITTNVVPTVGSSLYIAGLFGSASPSTSHLFVWTSPPGLVASTGAWDQMAGTLTLQIAPNVSALMPWTISFALANPTHGQGGPAAPTAAVLKMPKPGESLGKPLIFPTTFTFPSTNNERPFLVASFLNKFLEQSTPSPDTDNRLSLIVGFSVDMPIGTFLTVSGLVGSTTLSTLALPVLGNGTTQNGGPFASNAIWNQVSGSIVFKLAAVGVRSGVTYNLIFVLRNPTRGQDSPSVSISAGGAGITVTEISADVGSGAASPFLISDLLLKMIGQSTPLPGADNQITLTLAARAGLPARTRLTLSGLSGSSPASVQETAAAAFPSLGYAVIPFGGNMSHFVGNSGNLTIGGIVGMSVEISMAADEVYVLSFQVTNPEFGQRSPDIFIEASGPVVVPLIAMDKAPGFAAPLVIAGFIVKKVSQSDPAQSVPNTISLSLSFFVGLSGGSSITLSGLTGSTTADNKSLSLTNNCSVFSTSGSWAQVNGSMVIDTSQYVAEETICVISFTLTNPDVAQAAPSVYIEVTGIIPLAKTEVETAVGLSAPLTVAAHVEQCIVGGSTVVAGASNTMTLTLTIRDAFLTGDTITLSGFSGSKSPDAAEMQPFSSSCFSSLPSFSGNYSNVTVAAWNASWSRNSGSVVFMVNNSLRPDTRCVLSFTLFNPNIGQDAPQLSISGGGFVPVLRQGCASASGLAAPFLVQDFLLIPNVQQRSPFPGMLNMLQIFFATRTAVTVPATVVISGLDSQPEGLDQSDSLCLADAEAINCKRCVPGTLAPIQSNATLPDSVPQCGAKWNNITGILSIALLGNTAASTRYALEINFTNPLTPRPAPAVITVSIVNGPGGNGAIAQTISVLATGNNAPLLVAGWISSVLSSGQSSVAAGAINEITVTLAVTAALVAEGNFAITLMGLVGSATPDGILPVLAPPEFAKTANWWNNGTAVIQLVGDTSANISYVITLPLLNSQDGHDSAGPITVGAYSQSGQFLPIVKVPPAPGTAAPLTVAGWAAPPVLVFTAEQQETVSSANTSVMISPTLTLQGYFGTKITLSGLIGSVTPGVNAKLAINPISLVFGSYARWFQVPGSLVLIAQREAANPGTIYNITLPELSTTTCLPVLLGGAVSAGATYYTLDSAGPLISPTSVFTPGFVNCKVGALATGGGPPNSAVGAMNTISVTLVPNLDVGAPLLITVLGLSGSNTPSGSLNVSVLGKTLQGTFDNIAGTIKVTLHVAFSKGTTIVLEFSLVNGAVEQPSDSIQVAATCAPCSLQLSANGAQWQLVAHSTDGGGIIFPPISATVLSDRRQGDAPAQATPYDSHSASLLSPAISVEAQGPLFLPSTAMTSAVQIIPSQVTPVRRMALEAAGFVTLKIVQCTCQSEYKTGANVNQVELRLATYTFLEPGSRVVIAGLDGAATRSGQVQLFSSNSSGRGGAKHYQGPSVFAPYADWNADLALLSLEVLDNLQPLKVYTVALSLLHSSQPLKLAHRGSNWVANKQVSVWSTSPASVPALADVAECDRC